MLIPYYILIGRIKEYNISNVDFKDMNYEVIDNLSSYKLVKALKDFDEIVNQFHVKYAPDLFDCDDYALLFKVVCGLNGFVCGYAEGLCDGYPHAFNVIPYIIDGDINLILVEPQLVGVHGVSFWWLMSKGSNIVSTPYGRYEVRYIWL